MTKRTNNARMNILTAMTAASMLIGMSGGAFAATTTTSQLPSLGYIIGGNFYSFNYANAHIGAVNAAIQAAGGSINDIVLDLNGTYANYGAFTASGNPMNQSGFTSYATAHTYTVPNSLVVNTVTNGTQTYTAPSSVASVSAINSTAALPNSMTDGSAYIVNATVEDSSGSAITGLGNSDFSLTVGSSTLSGTATYVGNGQYTIVFVPSTVSPTSSGSFAAAKLSVDGTAIATANITVAASTVSQGKSTATFPSVTALNESGTYTISVTPMDANSNIVTLSGSPTVTLGTGSSAVTLTSSASGPSSAGVYTVTFTAPNAAVSTGVPIVLTYGGLTFTSSSNYTVASQSVNAISADFSQLPSTLAESGSYTIPVTVTDSNNNPVGLSTAQNSFTVTYQGMTSAAAAGTATSTPGVYDVTFTVPTGTQGATSPVTVTLGSNTSASTSNYKLGPSASTAISTSNTTVTWPTSTTLTTSTDYSATVVAKDANNNTVTGLASNFFTVDENGTGVTSTSTAPTSTPGTYTVTFKTSVAATNAAFTLVDAGANQYGLTFTATSQDAPTGVSLPTTQLDGAVLVSGQPVTIPVVITGTNKNLTTADVSMTYNGQSLAVTSVANPTVATGNTTYDVTFTAPATASSTGEALAINVDGQTATTTSTVTVSSLNNITPSLTVTAPASLTTAETSFTSGNTTYTKPATTTLAPYTSYFIDGVAVKSGADYVFGVPQSTVSAAIGSSTSGALTVAAWTPDLSNVGYNDLAVTTGASAVTPAANLGVTIDNDTAQTANDAGTYSVTAPSPVSYKSTVTFPTTNVTNQLQAGTQYSINATLTDAFGNPVSGVNAYNLAVGMGSASSSASIIADDATTPGIGVSGLTVTPGSTSGTYTITFTMEKAPTSTDSLYLYYSSTPTSQATALETTGGGTVLGSSSISSYSVLPAAVNAVTVGTATSSGTGPYDYTWTVTAADAYGNPITGLTYSDFAVADTTALTTFTGGSTLASGGFTVTPVAGTAGSYTVEAQSATTVTVTDGVKVSVTSGATVSGTSTF